MAFQTFTGKEYLKIDIANNFGLDKKDWDERINWFDVNQNNLESLIPKAEEPALFYAGMLAWDKFKRGESSAYPISLDATASGLQILSVSTGCYLSASLCNMVDVGRRMDAYTAVYEHMLKKIGDTAKISRDDVKKAVMTALFSSVAVPKRVFGEGALLMHFYDTMRELAPGAWTLNESFLSFWDETAYKNHWVLPDGFRVWDKIMAPIEETVHFLNEPFTLVRKINSPIPEGRSLGANVTHSIDGMVVREMALRCMFEPERINKIRRINGYRSKSVNRPQDHKLIELWDRFEKTGFLSSRILMFLDDRNVGHVEYPLIIELIKTFPKKPFNILTVHDCFRCLPNYGNDLRRQYNNIMAQIAGSDLLADIIGQLLHTPIGVNKISNITDDVLQANYALS